MAKNSFHALEMAELSQFNFPAHAGCQIAWTGVCSCKKAFLKHVLGLGGLPTQLNYSKKLAYLRSFCMFGVLKI